MEETEAVAIARLQEKMMAAEKALDLAADEFRRRLFELNGEAERLRNMQMTYVPRETYEMRHSEIENKMERRFAEMDVHIETLDRWKANQEGRQWIGGAIILIMAALFAAAARFIR